MWPGSYEYSGYSPTHGTPAQALTMFDPVTQTPCRLRQLSAYLMFCLVALKNSKSAHAY
jgi:hypothetical protein